MIGGENEVLQQLHQIAGVRPSSSWMNGYRSSISNARQRRNQETSDVLLQNILYEDLRDVVRESGASATQGGSSAAAAPPNNCAQQWRQIIRSQQPGPNNNLQNSSFKSTLPESFRLMVQVEELVDVSRNAETRYESGGNQQTRCLKLCISDGYYANGTAHPLVDDTNPADPMIAMEVSPVPNLTIQSKAGCKILLHGPIDIRWGVMMLHEGNTLVLGGEVTPLVEIQTTAIDQARKLAGVGVDPTIRALIWNPETGDEQDQDEGELESTDIPAQPLSTASVVPQAPGPPPPNSAFVLNNPRRNNPLSNLQHSTEVRQQQPEANPSMLPTQSSFSTNNNMNMDDATSQNSSTSRIGPPPFASRAHVATDGRPQQLNPYSRKNSARSHNININATVTANLHSNIEAQNNNRIQQSTPASFQANNTTTFQSIGSRNVADSTAADHIPPSTDVVMTDTNMSCPSVSTGITRNHDTAPLLSRDTNAQNAMSVSSTTNSPVLSCSISSAVSRSPEILSFVELRALLEKARTSEPLYQETFGRTFQVQMKQCAAGWGFNIVKAKKNRTLKNRREDKKEDKKYEYVLNAKFTGLASEQGVLSCTIASDTIQPYFGYTPEKMRQLNKTEKEQAVAHVKESGNRLKEAFYKLGTWQLTLRQSPEDFFRSDSTDPHPPLDGTTPIMVLLNRRDI